MKQLPGLALGMIFALAAPTSATEPPYGPQEQHYSTEGKYGPFSENKRRNRQKAGLPPLESLSPITKTEIGVPFSQKITVQLPDGRQYRMPVGYFATPGWYSTDVGEKPLSLKRFGAAFWYPNGRHLEVNPSNYPEYDPQEPGRPRPSPGDHVVKIRSIEPDFAGNSEFTPPATRFQNWNRAGDKLIRSVWDGNIRLNHPDDPFRNFKFYRDEPKENFSFFMTCTLNVPNPQCDMHLHDPRQNLGIRLTFPASEVANWRDIILHTRTMIASWQVIDPAAPAD